MSGVKFHVECTQNHVWGPPGARDMTNFIKHVFLAKDVLGENHGKKITKHYIEWCSQSTTRFEVGPRYKDIMIMIYYDILMFQSYL